MKSKLTLLLFLMLNTFLKGQTFQLDTTKLTIGDTIIAKKFLSAAIDSIKKNNYVSGFTKADTARLIFEKTLGPEAKEVANALHQMGRCKLFLGESKEANSYFYEAQKIRLKYFGSVHPAVAQTYIHIGNSYFRTGEFRHAIECYQKSLDIRINLKGLDQYYLFESYANLGVSFLKIGEYDMAIQNSTKALAISIDIYGSSDTKVAETYLTLCDCYNQKGQYDKAIDFCMKGLKIQQTLLKKDHPDFAGTYNNLSTSYAYKGEYAVARQYLQKCIDIRLSATPSDKKGIANAICNMGILCADNEELEEAEKLFFRALELRKTLFGPNHFDVASVYVNLGALYNAKGVYDKAIEFEEKALVIQKNNLDSTNVIIASTLNNLGNSYRKLNNLGNSYRNLNNSKKAIELYDKALSIKIKAFGSKHPSVALTYYNLGDAYFTLKDYKKSSSFYHKAIQSCNYINDNFENVNSQYYLIGILEKLARVNLIDNSLDESHTTIMKAISGIEYQFSSISESFTKSFWQKRYYPVYEQAIDIGLLKSFRDQNDSLKYNSFYLAEQSKAAILQTQLKEMNALRFAGIPDSLVEKEHGLCVDITWRQKQRKSLLDTGVNETDTSLLRVNNTLFHLKEQYRTLKSAFEKDFPNYYRLKYARQSVSIQDIQQKMLSSKQSLLEYFVGDSSIYIFVVKPDTFVVTKVKKDFQLDYWIDSLRSGLYGYYTCKQEEKTSSKYQSSLYQYTEYANRLYQKLFAPIDKILTDQVIIVPDGMLGYIPFDALLGAKPENINDFKTYPYLLNKYQFSYAYSVTLLKEMQEKEHKMRSTKNFAAFAPFYDGDISMLSNSFTLDSLMRKGFKPLIHSGEEVALASKIMNGDIFAGKSATKSKFTSVSGNYKILHLASHAHADQGVGDYSYISFTGDTVSYEQLYVQDLYNLQLNADMVVLSACQTGIGKLERGEGIISLARAFAYAGAKSIINSLWEVNDKSSSALMKNFYKELKKGKTKDNALRLAKKTYIEKTTVRGAHPFFWAAFIPIGDMSKL